MLKTKILTTIFIFSLLSIPYYPAIFEKTSFFKSKTKQNVINTINAINNYQKTTTNNIRQKLTTAKKKVQENFDKIAENQSVDNKFTQWSILENNTNNYKLAYPLGYKVNSDQSEKIEFIPPSGQGLIVGYINDDQFTVKVFAAGLSEKQTSSLNHAGQFIQASFEFTKPSSFQEQQSLDRFNNLVN